jgi:hypothetical protein
MYSFQIKKRNTSNDQIIDINTYLSDAYPDVEIKFKDGFANEVIGCFDEKAFKNDQNTHGGALDEKSIASENRYFDILIDGGITGIQQYVVDNDGNKRTISKENIVGLKFYARFWLPAGNKTGYLFIQKYESLSIKPLFDALIAKILNNHGYITLGSGSGLKQTTTQKRMKEFLKRAVIRDVTVISKQSSHDTGVGDAQAVTVKLKNVRINKNDKTDLRDVVDAALKNHGFTIADRFYDMKATYESRSEGKKEEEKTVKLGTDADSIIVIPNIVIPDSCIDPDGYPLFDQMKEFVDKEIVQIKIEAKM